jgi:hypothetical protein
MKKTLVLLAFAAFCFTNADAQKQIGGDITVEFEFTPLGSTPIGNYGIRGRLFTSETMAIRGQINYGASTMRTVIDQPNTLPSDISLDDQLNPELHQIDKSSSFGLMPGVEIHMDGTDNLSPYVGAVIDFGSGKNSQEIEMWGPNDIDNVVDYEKFVQWSETRTDTWSRFGIGGVLGFDYYFVDNCYLGAELNVAFSSYNYKDIEFSTSDDVAYSLYATGNTDDNVDYPPNVIQGDMSSFGMRAQGTIRLGCIFKQ